MRSLLTVIFCGASAGAFIAYALTSPEMVAAAEGFFPHVQVCLAGNPSIGLMKALGHLVTAASYVVIAVCLGYMMMVIRALPTDSVTWFKILADELVYHLPLFAGFILFCSIGHVLAYVNLYSTYYWAEAAWNLFGTGFISGMTAVALIRSTLRFESRLEEEALRGADFPDFTARP